MICSADTAAWWPLEATDAKRSEHNIFMGKSQLRQHKMVKTYVIAAVASLGIIYAYGVERHSTGWKSGRADLIASQEAKAKVDSEAKLKRQHVDAQAAAVAEAEGRGKAAEIVRQVIRYVNVKERDICTFDAERVRIKANAVRNASCITGFDDCAMPTGSPQ